MEVLVYGTLGAIWWLSSLSVLLPFILLLKFSKPIRDRWFAFFFMNILKPIFNDVVIPMREHTFELLNEELAKERKKGGTVTPLTEILEIGIGSGANLDYYPENSSLTALDMNESFETYFKKNQKKYPQITYKKTIHAKAEDMKEVDDSSMDLVICTFVLCSVDDIKLVLAEVQRVLKPGGKFLFLEHTTFPKSQWSFTVQKVVSPLWKMYFDGCNLDRDIANEIEIAGFSKLIMEKKLPNNVVFYVRPQIIGVATK